MINSGTPACANHLLITSATKDMAKNDRKSDTKQSDKMGLYFYMKNMGKSRIYKHGDKDYYLFKPSSGSWVVRSVIKFSAIFYRIITNTLSEESLSKIKF